MKNKIKILSILCVFAWIVVPAWSATPTPGTERERSRQIREYYEQQKRLQEQQQRKADEEDVIDETSKPEKRQAQREQVRFEVTRILTTPSELLEDTELREILDPLEGKEITLQELFDAVDAINTLYREHKQIAARAILPPQKATDGTVTIKLVEGRIGAIKIEGNSSTREKYIKDRIKASPGDLVQISRLEEDLFYFNTINDVRLRGVLKPGETHGTTDYIFRAAEPPRHQVLPFIDNAGTRDIGRERAGISYTNRSLFGYRDQLLLGFHYAEGTKAAYTSYNFPLTDAGSRAGINFDISQIDIVDGQLEPLNVEGDSSNLEFSITHPLIVTRGLLLNGFSNVSFKESSTDFDGVTLFKTTVRTFSAGFDTQWGNLSDSWYSRAYLTIADGDWGNVDGFFKINADLSWTHVFSSDHRLTLRGRGQWSDVELLPSVERIQVGGVSSVRGFREGLLIGDEGYFLSLEYNFKLPFIDSKATASPYSERLRGFLFVDHGGAFPFKGNNRDLNSDDFLSSAGVGLNINLGKKLNGRLAVGVPLVQRDDDDDSPRFHFYLQSNPF